MPFLISAVVCSDLACGQLIIRQEDMNLMRTLKEVLEVLDVKLVTGAVSLDQSDDKKRIVFLKDLLFGVIMKKILIESGSIDVSIIEEIHLTEPFLQTYLWQRAYQFFFQLELAIQKFIKLLNRSLIDALNGAGTFEIVFADMQKSAETKWSNIYSSAVMYSFFLFYLQ